MQSLVITRGIIADAVETVPRAGESTQVTDPEGSTIAVIEVPAG